MNSLRFSIRLYIVVFALSSLFGTQKAKADCPTALGSTVKHTVGQWVRQKQYLLAYAEMTSQTRAFQSWVDGTKKPTLLNLLAFLGHTHKEFHESIKSLTRQGLILRQPWKIRWTRFWRRNAAELQAFRLIKLASSVLTANRWFFKKWAWDFLWPPSFIHFRQYQQAYLYRLKLRLTAIATEIGVETNIHIPEWVYANQDQLETQITKHARWRQRFGAFFASTAFAIGIATSVWQYNELLNRPAYIEALWQAEQDSFNRTRGIEKINNRTGNALEKLRAKP